MVGDWTAAGGCPHAVMNRSWSDIVTNNTGTTALRIDGILIHT